MLMDDYGAVDEAKTAESLEWGKHIDHEKTDIEQNPSAAYNKLSEALRQTFPHEATCSMFCGGKKCKYCCPDTWKDDEQAVKGLYSHWVTDNILATSRPITEYVEKFDILDQFKRKGINAIINLQLPGEHTSCGNGVHDNEFSYQQQHFMDQGVFFYNFGWKDFGVAESMASLLDMVKVMQYAVSQGKVAVHCHAGKGRTGVLIACFLVFNNRISANHAVHFVRSKRPNSVQTGPQVKCIQDFEEFLRPLRIIFSLNSDHATFDLTQCLSRQQAVLHGYESRKLKCLPKVVYAVCERLLELAKKKGLLNIPSQTSIAAELESSPLALLNSQQQLIPDVSVIADDDPVLNPPLPRHKPHYVDNISSDAGEVTTEVHNVGHALIKEDYSAEVEKKVDGYAKSFNEADFVWKDIKEENDALVLALLLWRWLDHLKDPVIRRQDLNILFEDIDQPQIPLKKLDKGVRTTVTYLLEFIVRLQPIEQDLEYEILRKLVSILTHKTLIEPPISASSQDLRTSIQTPTAMSNYEKPRIFRYFLNLLEVVEDGMKQSDLNTK